MSDDQNRNSYKDNLDGQKCTRPTFFSQNCKKNHADFIPILKFGLDCLPAKYQRNEIGRCIKSLSILTTRIIVSVCKNGRNARRLGTGRVTNVKIVFNNGKRYAIIEVTTAYHVVRNNRDASRTTAELFYDDNQTRHAVKYLKGRTVISSNREEDWCIFSCYTKDLKLAHKMIDQLRVFQTQNRRINEIFTEHFDLAVIVSHPHGGPKHISIGTWAVSEPERFVVIGNGLTIIGVITGDRITYTIQFTCPDVVTGTDSEEVGIECEVLYPDGTTTLYPMWQMDRLVKYTKHELFMQGGLRDFREDDMYLEIELPGEETQKMDDNQQLAHYRDDLSKAIRIHMKQTALYFDTVITKQPLKHNNQMAVNFNRRSGLV